MRLYSYFRSSASFRVRIALALKGLDFDYVGVHLVRNEHLAPALGQILPAQLVPSLVVGGDDGGDGAGETALTQSLAIIEYLEETHPEPPLLPCDALGRARVRAIALDIACEIHPLDNLRVLRYLRSEMKVSEDDKNRWYKHWIEVGLEAVERKLAGAKATGRFCHGDTPGLADCCLVPQIFNARRFETRLDHVPTVLRIFDTCMAEPAFRKAEPSACPDAE